MIHEAPSQLIFEKLSAARRPILAAHRKPDGDTLRRLISEHKGEYADCNPLDGAEHSYIELGGWIGDQGLAMMLMGLGSHLGLWSVMTPNNMMPGLDEETKKMVAGMGLVSIMGK